MVVAAGSGTRLGGPPKQFRQVAGRRLVDWTLDTVRAVADGTVVVLPAGGDPDGTEVDATVTVTGADTRSGSVRAGLAALDGLADDDIVVVHDAARPLATPELFGAVVAAVIAGADAAVPGVPLADTTKRVVDGIVAGTVDRDGLVAVQTPQAFRCGVLRRAHAAGADATDDAGLVEAAGGTVAVVAGEPANRKVTTTDDLDAVAAVLAARPRPTGDTP